MCKKWVQIQITVNPKTVRVAPFIFSVNFIALVPLVIFRVTLTRFETIVPQCHGSEGKCRKKLFFLFISNEAQFIFPTYQNMVLPNFMKRSDFLPHPGMTKVEKLKFPYFPRY